MENFNEIRKFLTKFFENLILEKLIENFEKVWENSLKILEKFFVQNLRKKFYILGEIVSMKNIFFLFTYVTFTDIYLKG